MAQSQETLRSGSDPSSSNTTPDLKLGIANSFGNYLLNMDQRANFSQSEIDSKINQFNKSNTGDLIMKPAGENFGNRKKGTLDLNIIYKNKPYKVSYEKINE